MTSQVSYDVDETFGCHIWTGKLGSNGRPVVWLGRKPVSAHKYIYELEMGWVGEGKVLDHLCRRVLCVNPKHLEPVTKQENEWRKDWGYRCKRQRCAKGHDLSTAIVTPEMGRLCRHCMKESV